MALRACVVRCEMAIREIQSESDLRGWLREGWIEGLWGPLIWVEAARGGTSGAPDVFVPSKFGYIPVELKFWPRPKWFKRTTPMHVIPAMRASQRRLHCRIEYVGLRSAVLAYVGFGEFVLERGGFVSKTECVFPRRGLESVEGLFSLLSDIGFWEEKKNAKLARASSHEQQRKEHRK